MKDKHKPYFRGVAMAIILCGVFLLAVGIVEMSLNLWRSSSYSQPFFKIVGGFIVLALGYIHLELEEIRIK